MKLTWNVGRSISASMLSVFMACVNNETVCSARGRGLGEIRVELPWWSNEYINATKPNEQQKKRMNCYNLTKEYLKTKELNIITTIRERCVLVGRGGEDINHFSLMTRIFKDQYIDTRCLSILVTTIRIWSVSRYYSTI